MKKIAILLIMCAITLTASAQMGWLYDNEKGIAFLESNEEYLTGDFDKPTTLRIMLDGSEEDELVLLGLEGEVTSYKFRDNQQYVVVNCNGQSMKWAIETQIVGNNILRYFTIVEASKFIDMLCECDFFSITLPLFGHGITTFYYNTNGYPLDW